MALLGGMRGARLPPACNSPGGQSVINNDIFHLADKATLPIVATAARAGAANRRKSCRRPIMVATPRPPLTQPIQEIGYII